MNDHEYRDCAARIIQVFPELGDWFRNLPDEATRATQRELSKSLLMPLEASDVLAAISDLSKLTKPPWAGYGLAGKGAAFIAETAREIAGRRRSREDSERLCATARRRAKATVAGELLVSASGLAKDLRDARATGQCQTAAETRAWFAERLPGEEDVRDAVRCSVCQDSGRVQCLISVRRNADGSWRKWFGVASCPCVEGATFRQYREEEARVPMYDEMKHVRVIPGATEVDLQAEVRRVMDRRANKNRVPGFDAFNERVGAF